jgi:hypothetical protein
MTETHNPSIPEQNHTSQQKNHYAGHFDGVFGRVAMGWAFNSNDFSEVVNVEVVLDGRVVSESTASHFREDLLANGIGTGAHHFKCLLPVELFDGIPRSVHVRIRGIALNIPGGPHVVNKKLASLNDAFDSSSLNSAPPLSDFQVAMLRGLTSACETLNEHTKLLLNIGNSANNVMAGATQTGLSSAASFNSNICLYSEEFKRKIGDDDVVIFSIIDWDFRVQRPQHLAANFAKMGKRVIYVSIHLEQRLAHHTSFSYLRSKPTQGVYEAVVRRT